jgi:integrase
VVIVLHPADTKTGRADERPVPDVLSAAVDRYVDYYRPILARDLENPATGPLWLSSETGEAMAQSSVEHAIRRATCATLGVEIGPHMFRTAGATSAAALASNAPRLASALLQHVHPRITEQHYNRATSHGAAGALADALRHIPERNPS